jgi:hypothetical protein
LIYIVIGGYLPSVNIYAQFIYQFDIGTVSAFKDTGEKPQSKLWKHDNIWWSVIPVSDGTYIYHLSGNSWIQGLRLTTLKDFKADAKVDGDITHILLFNDGSTKLASVEYLYASNSYQFWTTRPSLVDIDLDGSGVETATIDIDNSSNKRMWLAYEGSTNINVLWSNSPYGTWNGPIVLETGVNTDDICAVTAFEGNKIGVLWSNQDEKKFQFSYHLDSETYGDPRAPTNWSDIEEVTGPVSGGHFADDHINLAVKNDGTLYAAVKTSYNDYKTEDGPTIALLKRSTSGTWSIYEVTNGSGTRPIALLDKANDDIYVMYTGSSSGSSSIVYKYSSTSTFSFSSLRTLKAGSFNNVASTKQNFTDVAVILFSAGTTWSGVMAGTGVLPVELAYFTGILNGNKVELRWRTETEVNNYGFNIESTKDNSDWLTIGFVEGHGNSNSPKQYNFSNTDINQPGTYNYRLKQIDNDGSYEYSDVVSVEVGVPNNFYLSQNYPNPFNPETRIDFTLPEKQFVTIKVYNTLGEQVAELVNEEREAGSYSVIFDASRLPSGVYIYRLQASSFAANKKMTFLK